MKRLLKKYNCNLEEYRKIRKNAKAKLKALQKVKHQTALANRKSKVKTKK